MIDPLSGQPISMYPAQLGQEEAPDPALALLEQLLGRIEPTPMPQAPQMPKQNILSQILGPIGDALMARATVRAGGTPQRGAFYQSTEEQRRRIGELQEDYRRRVEETEAANRSLTNTLKVANYQGRIKHMQDLALAGARESGDKKFTDRYFEAVGEDGKMHRYRQWVDTSTGQSVGGREDLGLSEIPEGEKEQKKRTRIVYDRQGNAFVQDVDTEETRPVNLPGGEGQAGKPWTSQDIEVATAAEILGKQLDDFDKLSTNFMEGSKKKRFATARSGAQTVVRTLGGEGGTGQAISESFGDPDFEHLSAIRNRIGQQLARLVERGRLSDFDLQFALTNLPSIMSLTTEDGRKTFRKKMDTVKAEIIRRLESNERMRPGMVPNASTGGDEYGDFLKYYESMTNATTP